MKDPINFLDDIKTGKITIKEAKNEQEDFNEFLEEIKKQPRTKENVSKSEYFFNGRNGAIEIIENIAARILESKRKIKEGTGLKILTPKQMLQRLPIALAQVKTGINPESSLNEIKQIVY